MTLTHFERQVKVHDEAITRTPPLLLRGSYRVPSSSGGEGGASSPPPPSSSAPSSSQAVAEGMLTAVIFWTNHDVSGWLAIRRPVPLKGQITLQPGRKNLLLPPSPIGLGSSHTIFWDPVAPDGGGAYVETPGPIRNAWNWNWADCFSSTDFGYHHDPSIQPWKAHWAPSAFRLCPLHCDLCFDCLSAQAQILLCGT
jgi:hypothetical protein